MSGRAWDAAAYDRLSAPLAALGVGVLDRLPLHGDETVLDVGCGTGRVTRALLERLPRGRVIAVDASPDMVRRAREALPATVDVRLADVLELELDEPVDAILSTATFHWILDHERLFARLHALLRPGGRLAAQCGGEGNLRAVLAAADGVAGEPRFAGAFAGFARPSYYASAEASEQRLRRAGFRDARCWLRPAAVAPEDPLGYLMAINLRPHLERLEPPERRSFAEQVLRRLERPPAIDYVRLEIAAER